MKLKSLDAISRILQKGKKPDKIKILHALGRSRDITIVSVLVQALEDKDADIDKLVFNGTGAMVPVMVECLSDPDPRVRQHAIYALQRLKVRRATEIIARMLVRDKNQVVRYNAALVLNVLVTNRKKYPNTYVITFHQLIKYMLRDDIQTIVAEGNGQDRTGDI